jgi:hypothetical protein
MGVLSGWGTFGVPGDVVVDLRLDALLAAEYEIEHGLVLGVLVGVAPVKATQEDHHWTADEGDRDRNDPLHGSHPPISRVL